MVTRGAYFTTDGQPRPEARPFFEYRFGSDNPEPGPRFRARQAAVAGKPGIFDDELILQSLVEGWSVEETCLRGMEVAADRKRLSPAALDQQKQARHMLRRSGDVPH